MGAFTAEPSTTSAVVPVQPANTQIGKNIGFCRLNRETPGYRIEDKVKAANAAKNRIVDAITAPL